MPRTRPRLIGSFVKRSPTRSVRNSWRRRRATSRADVSVGRNAAASGPCETNCEFTYLSWFRRKDVNLARDGFTLLQSIRLPPTSVGGRDYANENGWRGGRFAGSLRFARAMALPAPCGGRGRGVKRGACSVGVRSGRDESIILAYPTSTLER